MKSLSTLIILKQRQIVNFYLLKEAQITVVLNIEKESDMGERRET